MLVLLLTVQLLEWKRSPGECQSATRAYTERCVLKRGKEHGRGWPVVASVTRLWGRMTEVLTWDTVVKCQSTHFYEKDLIKHL